MVVNKQAREWILLARPENVIFHENTMLSRFLSLEN